MQALTESLRIRMEGGLEAIERATVESRRLARRLRRAGGPLGWLFLDRHGLADDVRDFAREQARVDDATARLERLGALEGWPDSREPPCLEELRRSRKQLAEAASRACLGLGGSPSGALVEDLARVESQLRGGPEVVDAPLVVEPADPKAPYTAQWKDFRNRRRAGVLLNLVGPVWIASLATSSHPVALLFVGGAWLLGNVRWAGWMGRFTCPRCKRTFNEQVAISPLSCDHCGLRRYEGDAARHWLTG
jgi:hypothetical protein